MDRLLSLSSDLFEVRKALALPEVDTEEIEGLGKRKRKRTKGEDLDEYLISSTEDSLKLVDA